MGLEGANWTTESSSLHSEEIVYPSIPQNHHFNLHKQIQGTVSKTPRTY